MMKTLTPRGNALALGIIVVLLISSMAAGLLTVTLPYMRTTHNMNDTVLATFAAESALELAWTNIATSGYNSNGDNLWLQQWSASPVDPNDLTRGPSTSQNAGYPGSGKPYSAPIQIGNDARLVADITVYTLGNRIFRVVADGRVRDPMTNTVLRSATLHREVRERDTFARYMFFVDIDTMSFGTTTVRGEVHDNRAINFYFGGGKFYSPVAARDGFGYAYGATTTNTTFYAGANPSASAVPMPSTNSIASLKSVATGLYQVAPQNPAYPGSAMNLDLTFMGNQMRMKVYNNTGQLVSDQTVPPPANGLIYVEGNVTGIRGDTSSRVTVATIGKITVDAPIRYVDGSGNLAYVLTQNGTVIPNNSTPVGAAWTTENGFDYVPNSTYSGSAVVGLMAQSDVVIPASAPYNMELHAAVFSSTSQWYCDLSPVSYPGNHKGNLRVLGSLVSQKAGWRYSSNASGTIRRGYPLSGTYIYDENLLPNPPPSWLPANRPRKGPQWKEFQS